MARQTVICVEPGNAALRKDVHSRRKGARIIESRGVNTNLRRVVVAAKHQVAAVLLDQLYAGHESGLIVPYRMAAVYVALGDKAQALEWLRKSYDAHDNWMAQLKVDPVMDPLRSEAQFQELMRKMRLS